MKINLAVFDLDGTLVSSHKTIYKATIIALKELKIKVELPEKEFFHLRQFATLLIRLFQK